MLSKLLIVGKSPETHIQTPPYPLNLTTASRLHCCQPEISRTPYPDRNQASPSAECPVAAPCAAIKHKFTEPSTYAARA